MKFANRLVVNEVYINLPTYGCFKQLDFTVSLHLAEKHFLEKHLQEKHFPERSFSRMNTCLKLHLLE